MNLAFLGATSAGQQAFAALSVAALSLDSSFLGIATTQLACRKQCLLSAFPGSFESPWGQSVCVRGMWPSALLCCVTSICVSLGKASCGPCGFPVRAPRAPSCGATWARPARGSPATAARRSFISRREGVSRGQRFFPYVALGGMIKAGSPGERNPVRSYGGTGSELCGSAWRGESFLRRINAPMAFSWFPQ